MTPETFKFPIEAVRCQRGDYILQRTSNGQIRIFRVDDLVKLSRLVPFLRDELIEEASLLDSERPAYMGEIHLLLTAFAPAFASFDEAKHALDAGSLSSVTGYVCLGIDGFPASGSHIYRVEGHGKVGV